MNSRLLILFGILFMIIVSCKDDDIGPEQQEIEIPVSAIYIAGYESSDAKYWMNGSVTNLTGGNSGYATGITVLNNDVYVSGWEDVSGGRKLLYWKNGTPTLLATGDYNTVTGGIAVKGNDIYVVGAQPNNVGTKVGKCWKNGIATNLSDGTPGHHCNADAIVVVENDVYIAGGEYNGSRGVAKYWKNGQAFSLTDGTRSAHANAIAVVGNDVYVAGYETLTSAGGSMPVAKYWKNGVAVSLSDGTKYNVATGIAVSGKNIYVSGYQDNQGGNTAKYWKNSTEINLTDGSQNAKANAIALSGSAVYITGFEGNFVTYWKNGKAFHLSNGSSSSSEGLALFLKK